MKVILSILMFFILPGSQLLAQGGEQDSLQLLLEVVSTNEEKRILELKIISLEHDSVTFHSKLNAFVIAVESESKVTKANLFYRISRLLYKRDDLDKAYSFIQNSAKIAESINDNEQLADAYFFQGHIEKKQSLFDKSLVTLKSAAEFYHLIEDYRNQVNCLNKMGILHKNVGNYNEALRLYHDAYDISSKYKIEDKIASTNINIGVVLKLEEKYDEALEYYFKAEEIYITLKNPRGLANVYNNIGNVYRLQGKNHNALSYYHLAIDNRIESGEESRLSYSYNNIALVHDDLKEYKKALKYLKISEDLKIKNKENESLSSTYLNYAEIYFELNDKKQFSYYWNKSRELAVQYHQNDTRRNLIVIKSRYEAKNKNFEAAYVFLSSVYDELDTLDVESQKILNSVLQAQFEESKNKNEIHELSDVIVLLDLQNKEIKAEKDTFRNLAIGFSVLILLLIILLVLLFFKQKAFKAKSKELAKTYEQLQLSTVSIDEKELLLKEIHHRVKNNLQIIKSLIRLQKSDEQEILIKDLLTDFELRVSSMALVHESLYKKGDIASVNVEEYFKNLIENLIAVYHLQQNVKLDISILIDELDIDTLVPLGLLSTEIVSNSMKYGISSKKDGKITLLLQKLDGDFYEIYIGDNGKGFDIEKKMTKKTLGIELIYTLVEQLDGNLQFSNENGAYYRIKFKAQAKKI